MLFLGFAANDIFWNYSSKYNCYSIITLSNITISSKPISKSYVIRMTCFKFSVLTHLFWKSTHCSYLFKQTLLFGNHKLLFVCSVQCKHQITSIIHNQYLQLTGVQIESMWKLELICHHAAINTAIQYRKSTMPWC